MNTRNKNIALVIFAVVITLAGVGPSFAQSYEWRVTSSKREDGVLRIVEQAPDGRTKTTVVYYFRHKPMVVQAENQFIRDRHGNKLSTRYWRWADNRRQIAHGEEFYDRQGYTFKGRRWWYEEENGRMLEPRIDERFNQRTKRWERV